MGSLPLSRSDGAFVGETRKERRTMQDFKLHCADRLDHLQNTVRKVEGRLSQLQSQWAMNKAQLEFLGKQIPRSMDLASSLERQLSERVEREDSMWNMLQELREEMHDLGQYVQCDEHNSGELDSYLFPVRTSEVWSGMPSLGAELSDVGEDSTSAPPAKPTRDEDGWWHSCNWSPYTGGLAALSDADITRSSTPYSDTTTPRSDIGRDDAASVTPNPNVTPSNVEVSLLPSPEPSSTGDSMDTSSGHQCSAFSEASCVDSSTDGSLSASISPSRLARNARVAKVFSQLYDTAVEVSWCQ